MPQSLLEDQATSEVDMLSDVARGERSVRKMCLPGICFSLFQGSQENRAAHAPCFPSQSQPRIKALNSTCTEVFLVIVKY